jgi:hypothetical protein
MLVACGGGGGGGSKGTATATQPPAATPPAGGTNSAPTIQGQPGGSVVAGQSYSFQPSARDADSDTLTFTVSNLPDWASFDQATGRLAGTPASADAGTYSGITIQVSDGQASASLAAFSITVSDIGTGTATVSWMPPTQNSDGSALTDLSGYQVHYGRDAEALDQSITLDNPSLNAYVVDNLGEGTWYFAVVAVNAQGMTSAFSNLASKTIG